MKYKCIFSDIDGTLLNSQHQISEKTKQIIQRLKKQGIYTILVSARMPKGMRFLQKELGIDDGLIAYSGGYIILNDQVIFSQGIQKKRVKNILNFIHIHSELCTTIYEEDEWYVEDKNDPWVKQEQEITGIRPKLFNYQKMKQAHKILCMGESDQIDQLEKRLKLVYSNLSIYKSKPTYLEIMDKSISKSKAMDIITNYYDIDDDQIVAFGDNFNDIDMLQKARWGFAMANAPIEVLQQVKHHTKSNDEDGIVYALEELIK